MIHVAGLNTEDEERGNPIGSCFVEIPVVKGVGNPKVLNCTEAA